MNICSVMFMFPGFKNNKNNTNNNDDHIIEMLARKTVLIVSIQQFNPRNENSPSLKIHAYLLPGGYNHCASADQVTCPILHTPA